MTKTVMGYVGNPCAALLADVPGFNVTGIQRRSARSDWKIECLNDGECPFDGDEPGLAELIHRVAVEKQTFRVTDDYAVCAEADVILIDVQTPTDTEQGRRVPHYESLREVSAKAGHDLQPGALVIIESTVAPGTTQSVVQPILEQESGLRAGSRENSPFAIRLIPLARAINDGMPAHVLALIEAALAEAGRELTGAKVTLGVSYLENADDTRNTPAAALARLLLGRGAQVTAHDPYVRAPDWKRVLGDGHDVPLTADLDEALRTPAQAGAADCAALVTRHRDYEALDFQRVKNVMNTPVIIDGRNIFNPAACEGEGVIFRAVGKA
jgi:UDP-N-acetyl-D-mannosaminuronate dehydrogenase